jgi:hypothetical protein
MRGAVLASILFAITACGPAGKPPVDPSNSDDSTSSSKSDTPAESWGSSETASAASSKLSTPPPAETTPAPSTPSMPPADTTPAPPTDSGPHVPASLGGASYDRKTLEVALKRAARQVKANCGAATDENGAATGPWGKTTITVKLGHNGHSKGGTVPAPFDGKSTGRCVTQAFSNLIYAPFAGSDTDVDWPVEVVKP